MRNDESSSVQGVFSRKDRERGRFREDDKRWAYQTRRNQVVEIQRMERGVRWEYDGSNTREREEMLEWLHKVTRVKKRLSFFPACTQQLEKKQ